MTNGNTLFEYLLRLGDNALILSQRLGEWCGHGPVLEEDLALTNVALDLLGQARFWLSYAGEVEGAGRDEDQLAFLRDSGDFRNLLLVEQPNGHYGETMARQLYFDSWHYFLLRELERSTDPRIAGIAAKALKEVTYHLERSTDWVVRLGDGTAESHARMQGAIDALWMYTGELFEMDPVDNEMRDRGIGADLEALHGPWLEHVGKTLAEATLRLPSGKWMQRGGKQGVHTEKLGFILAEMQYPAEGISGGAVVAEHPPVSDIWNCLKEVADPEIPVLSVVDLGIVREVRWNEQGELVIAITPTYSGCPAMEMIARDIRSAMKRRGIERLRLETKLSPAWTTDWMTDEAKVRLREYGIAPPSQLVGVTDIRSAKLVKSPDEGTAVRCPRCGSEATDLVSRYGSTACKALYKCRSCLEPFDVFKSH